METFMRVVPFGDFYKKEEAVEIVRKEVENRKLRFKMLHLLVLIPEKKSLLLAQKALKCRRIEEIMDQFATINLSPVTISKRQDVKHLESLYRFLDNKEGE